MTDQAYAAAPFPPQARPLSFGEAIRAAREARGLPQQALADLLDVSVPYVSDVERERRGPFTPEKTRKVAELLGIDSRELQLLAILANRGSVRLKAPNTPAGVRCLAVLVDAWDELPDDVLETIAGLAGACR